MGHQQAVEFLSHQFAAQDDLYLPLRTHSGSGRLRIKAFYGASENAVKTQVWIAVSVYLLVAIVRTRLGLGASLYRILQTLSETLFEKTLILPALQASDFEKGIGDFGNQLILCGL